MTPITRLPWAPLERALLAGRVAHIGADIDCACAGGRGGRQVGYCMNLKELGAQIGIGASTVKAWRRDGVPIHRADHAAVASGHHQFELWPELIDLYAAEADAFDAQQREAA